MARKRRAELAPEEVAQGRLAYTIAQLSQLVSISENQLRRHIAGELEPQLVASYSGRKAVILREEAERWVKLLPNDLV